MKLSAHFSLAEFTKSQTAERKGIDNTPDDNHIEAMEQLCHAVLEEIRYHFQRPMVINSGYRSPALCEAIGSKSTSQHAKGQAADIEIPGVDNLKLAQYKHGITCPIYKYNEFSPINSTNLIKLIFLLLPPS